MKLMSYYQRFPTGVVSAENIKQEQKQKKIKLYDFKRPDKFSKDQIRTLYMLHENFARLLNTLFVSPFTHYGSSQRGFG